ncbi:uncharacterized protein LOC108735513 [Agrilus planipennis]|uniref:Uncharacterized protein LOC108735513 n=1 Tax=Agrilus planipennis TaxID=224129 RepID=A0A7F5RLW2_AGRPL|nr:uncharacterized protein LOC108735513 [Agrilus planipennis]
MMYCPQWYKAHYLIKNFKFAILGITLSYSCCITQKRYSFNFPMETKIKSFVFMDCETTGLPFEENNRTKITELTLCVVQSIHIEMGVFPRIQDKLHLCFNPQKLVSPAASTITKLSNDLLEKQPAFTTSTANLIREFIDLHPKPVCLVAHNGNKFDYPILKAELLKAKINLSDDILCVDSLEAVQFFHSEDNKKKTEHIPFELQDGFDELIVNVVEDLEQHETNLKNIAVKEEKTFVTNSTICNNETQANSSTAQQINETTPKSSIIQQNDKKAACGDKLIRKHEITNPKIRRRLFSPGVSFKLEDVFQRITGQPVSNSHTAECDVDSLIRIAATFGERFTCWANFNCRKFSDIPAMTPGKRIGT